MNNIKELKENGNDLTFLEKELPKKVYPLRFRKYIGLLSGEINVKPISVKMKKWSDDKVLKLFVSDNKLRPEMTGIYCDAKNKCKIATDARTLILIPDDKIKETKIRNVMLEKFRDDYGYDIEYDGIVIDKDSKYPSYESVIPKKNKYKGKVNRDWLDILAGVSRASKFCEYNGVGIVIKIVMKKCEIYFKTDLLKKAIEAMYFTGCENIIIEANDSCSAILLKDADSKKLCLVMPFMANSTTPCKSIKI